MGFYFNDEYIENAESGFKNCKCCGTRFLSLGEPKKQNCWKCPSSERKNYSSNHLQDSLGMITIVIVATILGGIILLDAAFKGDELAHKVKTIEMTKGEGVENVLYYKESAADLKEAELQQKAGK